MCVLRLSTSYSCLARACNALELLCHGFQLLVVARSLDMERIGARLQVLLAAFERLLQPLGLDGVGARHQEDLP